jgi:hypothetical protein
MKLILAGLLVFVGLFVAAAALDAFGLLEGASGPVLGLAMGAALVGSTVLAGWLLRERGAGPDPEQRLRELRRAVAGGARLEPDPALDFRFEFVSTHADLLDGHRGLRRDTTGLRPWVRACVILMGLAWLLAGAGVTVHDLSRGRVEAAPLVWLLLGTITLGFFVVRPWRQRNAIRRGNTPTKRLALHFTPIGIEAEVEGSGLVRRHWWELLSFSRAPKGILLEFTDDLNWLPGRIFESERQRERFEACLATRTAQELIRAEAPTEPHPILPEAETYTVASARRHETADGAGPCVDLTLRRGEIERHLRAVRVRQAWIEDELVAAGEVRVEVLRLPFSELDGLTLRISEAEPHGALEIVAEDIVDLDAQAA